MPTWRSSPLWLCLIALAGCGGASQPASHGQTAAIAPTSTTPAPAVDELTAAQQPSTSQFPAAAGHSLRQLSAGVASTAQFGAATGTYTPGTRRLAFALTTKSNQLIYAPSAVYLATSPTAPAQGPFLAPADPTTVPAQFRSAQNAGPGGLKAIYHTQLPLPHPGVYDVLTLTRTAHGMIGSPGEVAVAASSPIPDVGQRPPAITTDTLASVHGNLSLVTTRTPPEQMHSVSFGQVLGQRPVALLFSTPELCTSRVCGPVTDIAVDLQSQFGSRITFIHQEVYVDNKPNLGLRPQLKAFHLQTEPWLFTVNRRGIIAARLEGAFGVNEVRQALQAALSG
ncbi:MAG TPA: hypothetical protein VGY32_02310 [Solirubrobacteraceae bacterium]|nr:hypothetical protein [Solirubrobacteraceae bacterium]